MRACARTNASSHTYNCRAGNATNMNASCHTYERVMLHAWMHHVQSHNIRLFRFPFPCPPLSSSLSPSLFTFPPVTLFLSLSRTSVVCTCVCACVRVCVCMCVCAYMCAMTCVYVPVWQLWTCVYIYISIHVNACSDAVRIVTCNPTPHSTPAPCMCASSSSSRPRCGHSVFIPSLVEGTWAAAE